MLPGGKRVDAEVEQLMSLYQLKGTAGSVINQSFPCGENLLLGSSTDCDVQLGGPGIAPWHAEITLLSDKALHLQNLDPAFATLLNGESVTEHLLASGDEIRMGSCRLMLQAPGLRPERILTDEVVKPPSRRRLQIVLWGVLLLTATTWLVLEYFKI